MLAPQTLLMLLDSDIVAMRPLADELLGRCADVGVGAFDISDQVFPAYGSANVIKDLEIVAGRFFEQYCPRMSEAFQGSLGHG